MLQIEIPIVEYHSPQLSPVSSLQKSVIPHPFSSWKLTFNAAHTKGF